MRTRLGSSNLGAKTVGRGAGRQAGLMLWFLCEGELPLEGDCSAAGLDSGKGRPEDARTPSAFLVQCDSLSRSTKVLAAICCRRR